MIASLLARLGRLLLVAGCVVGACLAAGCAAAGHAVRPSRADASPLAQAPRGSHPFPARTAPRSGVPALAGGPARLAGLLSTAEGALGRGTASPAAMDRQALIVQLACLRIAAHPGWANAVTSRVAPAQRAAATADIAATADLVALTPPAARLPHWRIVPAQKLAALRSDYRAAQADTGVGWHYLAAINFVETDFGRIIGPSSAGAQGPMQFLPATWATYGHGNIYRPRNAIFAAARFLAAHGAPADIGSALYAYNPSPRYVDAVLRYAHRLHAHPRALVAYYHRQILYRLARGWVLLPPGYGTNPTIQALPLHT